MCDLKIGLIFKQADQIIKKEEKVLIYVIKIGQKSSRQNGLNRL